MKKSFILYSLLLISLPTLAQSSKGQLKKKYYGKYEGKMNAYFLSDGISTLQVEESDCRVVLQPNILTFAMDERGKEGSYSILLQTKDYVILEVHYDNDPMRDRFILPKKGKLINREGLTPQPNVTMKKLKK